MCHFSRGREKNALLIFNIKWRLHVFSEFYDDVDLYVVSNISFKIEKHSHTVYVRSLSSD